MSNLKLRTVKKHAPKKTIGKNSDKDSKIRLKFNVCNFSVRIYVCVCVG